MAAEFGAVLDLVTSPGMAAWRQASGPVWLWSPAAGAMRWANGAALALWRAPAFRDLSQAADPASQPGLDQLAHIIGTLPRGTGRIERLRLFLNGRAMNLTCRCELVSTTTERLVAVSVLDQAPGIAGAPDAPENLLRGIDRPALAAEPGGTILYANPAAGGIEAYGGVAALAAGLAAGADRHGEITRGGNRVEARARLVDNLVVIVTAQDVPDSRTAALRALAGEEPDTAGAEHAPEDVVPTEDEPAATEVIFNPAWETRSAPEPPESDKPQAVAAMPEEDEDNVLPFRGHAAPHIPETAATADEESAPLAAHERDAFRHLARALGARMESDAPRAEAGAAEGPARAAAPRPSPAPARASAVPALDADEAHMLLSRLPLGILIYRQAAALYANRAFLEMFGFADFAELTQAGDVSRLMPRLEADDAALLDHGMGDQGVRPSLLVARDLAGRAMRVVARLQAVRWHGEAAMLLSVRPPDGGLIARADGDDAPEPAAAPARASEDRAPAQSELETIVGLATDGVAILDEDGAVTLIDRQAESLFAATAAEVAGKPFADLFAHDSRASIAAYLDAIKGLSKPSLAGTGRRVTALAASGAQMPLHLIMGRLSDAPERRYCAVLRDIAVSLKTEADLTRARKQAESASQQKSEFIARVSHELRTPLNSIMGFSEVMLEERFGALGNERYLDYIHDIHASGKHVLGLVNDLLDLSRVEAGKLELNFTSVDVNEVAVESVRLMLQEAARGRVIVRSSLGRRLPAIVADHRSLRQILLNLLSNAIKFTLPGGQVVLATRLTDAGEVQVRVRDTGIGMEEQDMAVAMEPFRQVATAPAPRTPGAGLGLPLTKALAHANRARFRIESQTGAGTLTEITFPPRKVLAT